MNAMSDFDRRLGDWLEDGPQTVPDWLVDEALEQAHAAAQLRPRIRVAWPGRWSVPVGRSASVAAGAVTGLAVVAAFVLGVLTGPRVGDQPSPVPSQTSSPGPAASVVPRPLAGVESVDVLPGETPEFASLIGLAASANGDAVWTVVFTEDGSRLVRFDAATAAPVPMTIPGAGGILSPPAVDDGVVWTGSTAGLHAIEASGIGDARTLPLSFTPAEISAAEEGLWVAHEGGAALIDPSTGQVLREVRAPPGTVTGRVIGAPAFGRLWVCVDPFTVGAVDPVDGSLTSTTTLPAGSDCNGRVYPTTGIDAFADGVIPLLASVVVDPSGSSVATSFEVGGWSDVIAIDGKLWFLAIMRDQPGSTLALTELDSVTLRPAQVLTFEGALHLDTAFESGYLAVAGGYLWVLADPVTGGEADTSPRIVRVALSQLRDE